MRLMILVALVCLLWEPIRPVRGVTADALHTVARIIAY
jgi:hypothetical protein